jgi:hypothetical protein
MIKNKKNREEFLEASKHPCLCNCKKCKKFWQYLESGESFYENMPEGEK